MDLHRDFADADFRGGLLVHEAGTHQTHNLLLALAEPLELGAQPRRFFVLLTTRPIGVERNPNGIEKVLFTQWLGEELDRAGLHGFHRHRNIAMTGNEDDRGVDLRPRQFGLEIETAQSRQPDIQNQAAQLVAAAALQEFGGRAERFALKTD